MKHALQTLFISFAAALLPLAAGAEDSITIRFVGGYPLPGKSLETLNLRVARFSSAPLTAAAKQEVDRFFDKASAVLTADGVTADWQLAIPDAPFIEITIEINGRKVQLVSCHTLLEQSGKTLVLETGAVAVPPQGRAALLAGQSESFRRHRIAFEKILALALEETRSRLSPASPAITTRDVMPPPPDNPALAASAVREEITLLGTVTTIRIAETGNSLTPWLVRVKVDRVISGSFAGETFFFAVHSPTQSGLEEGRQYQIRVTRTADGDAVDEHQWKRMH